MKGKVYIKTFGCQMNVRDSSSILGILRKKGFEVTEKVDEADVVLLNTCAVREKAEQKVFSEIGRLRRLKVERPSVVIGVGGCVAQETGESILRQFPHVDVVFGTHAVGKIGDILDRALSGEKVIDTGFTYHRESRFTGKTLRSSAEVREYVTVTEGCDNFCSYCIVPYVRGREISRPPEDIISEIKCLIDAGTKEVTLVGQNVNSYGKKEGFVNFAELLKMVNEIDGIERIRFITSHPRDFDRELAECFALLEHLSPHLHLPVQSGSSRVLALMNRGYTREEYLKKIEMVKNLPVKVALSTDVIVGFPGETEKDFLDTLSLLKEVEFDFIFSFAYSPRPGTPAEKMDNQVPFKERLARLQELQKFQKEITLKKNMELVGKVTEVLVEGRSRRKGDEFTGRTPCNRVVNFPASEDVVGKVIRVKIVEAHANSLRGEVLENYVN